MHAFLIVGKNEIEVGNEINNLKKKLNVSLMDFPLTKIEEVRDLNSFTAYSVTTPTAILVKNIDEAGLEALNAFLKNLEEPQENLYYILTTNNIHKVVSTIVSRCQIIYSTNTPSGEVVLDDIELFIKGSNTERIGMIEKLKGRVEARDFVEKLLTGGHQLIHKKGVDQKSLAKLLEIAQETLIRINANGNPSLQLTNMVVNCKNCLV